jgi:hypothetical protein
LGGCNSKATTNPPKSDDKNGQEMFNWSELHSEEVTSYKIHTLVSVRLLQEFFKYPEKSDSIGIFSFFSNFFKDSKEFRCHLII